MPQFSPDFVRPRIAALATLAIAAACAPAPAQKVEFNRDIRPIMADTCFRCHGPDKSSRMAGMRLDIREEALKPTPSKVIPIVPGKPDESAIIQRVFASSPAKRMPPNSANKDLTEAQKQTLRRWVAEGAEYQRHWAYLPVSRPPVPELASADTVRNPVDAFIQSRLRQEGLAPAPEADRRTLIRRASLDITGLPPTPAEVRAFLADTAPNAYERVVDRLLASPRYAEKQTMHWLDAVRYADTCGFHGDNPLPAWPYRDYVLRAFRDNTPFDQFTREQLAGDLLPGATVQQRVASAYNRLNRTSAEGGIQPKEYLAKYGADRVRTTSTVWMGSTMGCAECHDHKFDPFTARDFYSMKAFFADIKETGLVEDRGPKAWGTQLALPSPQQQKSLDAATVVLKQARARLENAAGKLAGRRAQWEKALIERYETGRLAWKVQYPLAAHSLNGAVLGVYNDELVDTAEDLRGSMVSGRRPGDGLVVVSGPNPDRDVYTIRLRPGAGKWTALGVQFIQDESLPGARLARGSDRLVLSEVEARVPSRGAPGKLAFALATANTNYPRTELPAMAAIDGDPRTGWGIADYGDARAPFLALRFSTKLTTGANTVLEVKLRHESAFRRATAGRFRLALSSAEYSWPGIPDVNSKSPGGLPDALAKALRTPAAERTPEQSEAIADLFEWAEPSLTPLAVEAARLAMRRDLIDAGIPRVVVAESTEPAETRVLPRGNFLDDSGEVVAPAIPAFLGKLDSSGRATRLDLANWLISPKNPLTARTFVNRLWRQFFGTGLSKTLDDLGSQGEWPTHMELLDWLASEFVQPTWQAEGAHAWDVRHAVRVIVTSHTYRQSSMLAADADAKDPYNRLLARQSRFRVDAETVRDVALASAGLLVEKFGGPSVRPYQPDGYLAALNFPKRDYSAGRGPDLYRRSVYTHWQRSYLHPLMVTFDAPTREECTVNRVSSNTPLQALVLLNEPGMVEAARVLAARSLEGPPGDPAHRIARVFDRALQRSPAPEELSVLLKLHRTALDRFRASPPDALKLLRTGDSPVPPAADPPELAAMTVVARAILNLHETITRD